jgi:hypothetical protein
LIKNKAVTNAKLANLSAASQLKGSASSATTATDITVGLGLIMTDAVLTVNSTDLTQIIYIGDQPLTTENGIISLSALEFSQGSSVIFNQPSSALNVTGPNISYRLTFTCTNLFPNTIVDGSSIIFAPYNATSSTWLTNATGEQSYGPQYGVFGNNNISTYFTTTLPSTDIQMRIKALIKPEVSWTMIGATMTIERLI